MDQLVRVQHLNLKNKFKSHKSDKEKYSSEKISKNIRALAIVYK